MLTGIHVLLTYSCNYECDHCFLYCGPHSKGTFTLRQISDVLDEAKKMGTVEWIFYEGGEPFLFFPVLVEGIRRAKNMGFKVGVVTNAYPSFSEEDAELWLRPLADEQLDFLSVSDDDFHNDGQDERPAKFALTVAKRLGIPTSPINIGNTEIEVRNQDGQDKGQPVVSGGPKFRGRAIEKLSKGLPRRPWDDLTTCPYEDLVSPSRVHVDPYGNVHLCQGLSMGNMWNTSLSELVSSYHGESHPICGPLARGGPAQLARELGLGHETGYIDECHFCFMLRRAMIDKFPEFLAPEQVYGLDKLP